MASQHESIGIAKTLDIADITLFHRNAHIGDVEVIAESLNTNGQYRPVVVNTGSKTGRPLEVLAGNHTVQAAKKLGWTTVDAFVIDVDDTHATRINLADNQTAMLGEFDDAALAALLSGFGDDLTGTGYTHADLATLQALAQTDYGPELLGDVSEPSPEPPAEQQAEPAPESSDESAPDAPGPRSISLSGLPPRYLGWIQDQLTGIKEANEMESYADVLVMLVMAYTGDRPSADGHEDLTGA